MYIFTQITFLVLMMLYVRVTNNSRMIGIT